MHRGSEAHCIDTTVLQGTLYEVNDPKPHSPTDARWPWNDPWEILNTVPECVYIMCIYVNVYVWGYTKCLVALL